MAKNQIFPLNTPFKPSTAFITWFIVDFILVVLLTLSFTVVPVLIASDLEGFIVGISLAGVLILVVVFVAWVRLYYTSMWYELREDDIELEKGCLVPQDGDCPV